MSLPSRFHSQIEPLEARIAPAVVITNPLPDIVAGVGKTGAVLDLSQLTAATSSSAYHTTVRFITNYDTDAVTPGLQAGEFVIELYDDLAPLSVQNFLAYVNNANARGDYDGTYFHRAAFLDNGTPFVLQGGGYEAATPTTHIPVAVAVHNEFNPSRSNLAGTVAMAKVGGDPNSATSEWFVNLGNNSANLDNQNGGFTVFGKVTDSSLALAKTIANLPKVDLGLGQTTPVQAGHPLSIVDAIVTSPAPGSTTGLTYTIESVNPTGGAPADLITTAISGSQLTLSYGAGKSGTANVTVKVSDGTESKTDTFSVDVRPNAAVKLTADSLPKFILPGDAGTVKFSVSNNGAVAGAGTVKFYLLKQNVTKNSFGQITSLSDATPASVINLISAATVPYTLASGKTQTFTVPLKLALDPFASDEAVYRVVTEVVPADTALTTEEKFSDDNLPSVVLAHDVVNKFGTLSDVNFGTRVNAVLKYSGKSAAGDSGLVTWTMKGPGSGTVGFDAQHENVSLTTQGTTLASTVTPTFSKAGSHLALDNLNFTDTIGTASLGLVDVSGLIAASGGIKTLTLGNLTGESLLLIGLLLPENNVKAAITLGGVTDFSIQSSQPLASLTTKFWHDTAGSANDLITAPSLGILKVTGNFEADVTLTDETQTPSTAIAITGLLQNATIKTAGNLGAVTLGGISGSSVFAGVEARPTNLSAFSDARTIQSFTITGIASYPGSLFVDSQVAAQTIGAIKVKTVSTSTTGTFGFVADVIKTYSRTATVGQANATLSNLTTAQTADDFAPAGGYSLTVL